MMKLFAFVLSCALSVAGTALAAPPDGHALFQSHCASCHGVLGHGDGPMEPVLSVDIPDLTELELRAGGDFPLLYVLSTIDGRLALQGHGGPMPVFGPILGGGSAVVDGPDGTVFETSADLLAIVRWLESQQR